MGNSIITLNFDGACRPGRHGNIATCGWTLADEQGRLLSEGSKVIGIGDGMTNNWAEWCALGFGLRSLLTLLSDCSITNLSLWIQGDSQLVVNQMGGTWKCKNPRLSRCYDACHRLIGDIHTKLDGNFDWDIKWVARHKNGRSHDLAEKAIIKYRRQST